MRSAINERMRWIVDGYVGDTRVLLTKLSRNVVCYLFEIQLLKLAELADFFSPSSFPVSLLERTDKKRKGAPGQMKNLKISYF